ncbi:unnamed protein product [Alternaria alternata]
MASSPPMLPQDDDADMLDDDDIIRDVDDLDEDAEEAEGIDLFADDFENDYAARENDAYEGQGIDDEGDYEELSLAQRRELDARLNARDREARRRMPAAFLPDEDEQDGLAGLMGTGRRRVRRNRYDEEDDMDMTDDIMNEELTLEALTDVKANTLTDWVAQPQVARTIAREFKSFLTEYTDEQGHSVYGARIRTLGEVNAESQRSNTPTEMLKIFDQVAMEVALLHYPDYERIHSEIHVRITDVPVHGVVTRRSGVFPQLKSLQGLCQRDVCLATARSSLWDLIDSAKPGEEIEVTGIYRNNYDAALNNKNGFPVFATILEANYVVKSHDQLAGFRLTEDNEKEIRRLSKDAVDKVINSIAPRIYGHTDIKTAVALSLFGGVSKEAPGRHSIRGDINVLLLGDPGTAKSQILKYLPAVGLTASVRRDPMTSEWTLEGGALVLADKGTCLIDEFDKMNDQDRTSIHEAMEQQTISISKAGIVTTLQARCSIVAAANPIGGRYNSTIPFSQNVELTEPILSRFDILCVVRDTVDPAEDERLAKFVVNSHGRAHPLVNSAYGYSDKSKATQNGDDQMEVDGDAPIKEGEIPQDLLRKYILYARRKCRPKLYQIEQDKIARLFADMRRESMATGAYPITVRHLEAILRIAESFCKMRLSDYVASVDIDRAIAVAVDSFVGSQKVSAKKALARAFAKYTLNRPGAVGAPTRGGRQAQRAAA